MLTNKGPSLSGGDMSAEHRALAEKGIGYFEARLKNLLGNLGNRRRRIRPSHNCSIYCGYYSGVYFVGYHPHIGMPVFHFMNLRGAGSVDDITYYNLLVNSLGVDFCVFSFREEWINSPNAEEIFAALADSVIVREVNRYDQVEGAMQNIPIFGPNRFPVREELVFVLMPFSDDLTEIYNSLVKSTVESKGFVCRRADDITSNSAIISDIYKSICESRFVIADISQLNPNVMYELGIAHTLGKETIIIHQDDGKKKFPFDLAHIRIISYQNTAAGGRELVKSLSSTIDSVVQKLAMVDLVPAGMRGA